MHYVLLGSISKEKLLPITMKSTVVEPTLETLCMFLPGIGSMPGSPKIILDHVVQI